MGVITIDLTNYRDRTGSLVPKGRYRVIVDNLEEGVSHVGNSMITVWFRILEGNQEGEIILDRLVLTEKSMFRMVGFLQALAIPTPKKSFRLDTKQFVGKTLDIDVDDNDPYLGRVTSGVRAYLKIINGGGGVADPMLSEETSEADSTPSRLSPVGVSNAPLTIKGAGIDVDELDDL
jgi:hypothetical protein